MRNYKVIMKVWHAWKKSELIMRKMPMALKNVHKIFLKKWMKDFRTSA